MTLRRLENERLQNIKKTSTPLNSALKNARKSYIAFHKKILYNISSHDF